MPTDIKKLPDALPLDLDLNYMPDDIRRRAKVELFEDEDTRVNSLRLLRSMLRENEPDLHFQDEDQFLLQFLRARKFDVKRAFHVVKNFYTVRAKYRELYDDFDYATVQKTINSQCIAFLPYRDAEGCVILVIRPGSTWDPLHVTLAEVMRTLTSGLVDSIRSPVTQVVGYKVIVDFNGFALKQLPHITPGYLWLFAEALQNCFPARFKAVHIYNEGALFTYIWAILKQLLTKKLRDRFHFHGKNEKKLHKYFSTTILPEELGGDLGPLDNSQWASQLSKAANYLDYVYSSYGYKRSKNNHSEAKKVEK